MLKAILVDDHKDDMLVLSMLLRKTSPEVEIMAEFTDANEAAEQIGKLKPDVIFLDVQMRETDGFEVLSRLTTRDFEVIFITSHEKFALRAIKAGAIDYLVKPVQPQELKAAIEKVITRRSNPSAVQMEMLLNYFKPNKPKVRRVALTASDHLMFVEANDIIYCESDSNYTTFFLKSGEKVVISKTLKDVEEILAQDDFFRIHASYLVNMKHVAKFTRGDSGSVVMSNGQHLSVSRKKKDEFFEMFSRL
ncbi:MAG TPA: LytTR family DNA-binding domain-containing protein [Chryseosolibacter sp.]